MPVSAVQSAGDWLAGFNYRCIPIPVERLIQSFCPSVRTHASNNSRTATGSSINWILDNSNTVVRRISSFRGTTAPSGPRPPHYRGFTITLRHTALERNPLDESSVRRTDLYLTTYNTHRRQASMPSAGFEPAIPAIELPQTHALDSAGTGIGVRLSLF
jgi:hypothetical protein